MFAFHIFTVYCIWCCLGAVLLWWYDKDAFLLLHQQGPFSFTCLVMFSQSLVVSIIVSPTTPAFTSFHWVLILYIDNRPVSEVPNISFTIRSCAFPKWIGWKSWKGIFSYSINSTRLELWISDNKWFTLSYFLVLQSSGNVDLFFRGC